MEEPKLYTQEESYYLNIGLVCTTLYQFRYYYNQQNIDKGRKLAIKKFAFKKCLMPNEPLQKHYSMIKALIV